MGRTCVILTLAVVLMGLAANCWPLDLLQFRQLAVLQDEYVTDMLVTQAGWLADERGLVLGGWQQWPNQPAITVAPYSGTPVALDRPALPYFAMSPARNEIAYWVATGAGWTQLGVVPVSGGTPRYVGEPRRIGSAMQLAWPTGFTVCALIQEDSSCTAYAINTATGIARPMVRIEGGQWTRLRQWPGWDPIAVWVGNERKCFRLTSAGRTEEISPDFDFDRARPDAASFSYFDASGALWLGGHTDRTPEVIAKDAGAACWAPDGSILLYAKKRELWSAWPETGEQHRMLGSALDNAGLEASIPVGMIWSGDGGTVAYWRTAGASGQVRRARIGLEEILVRVRFDSGTSLKAGQPLWVAKKLYFDKAGRVKEPVWETLKGQFAVRKILPGTGETVVEAVNVGTQAGALERIAGRSAPQPSIVDAPTCSFTLKPIPGLYAWPQGTKIAGELMAVEVNRVFLGAGK